MRKLRVSLKLLIIIALFICVFYNPAWAEKAAFKPRTPILYSRDFQITRETSSDPILYTSKTKVNINEPFYLSWCVPDADWCILYKQYNDGEFIRLGSVNPITNSYMCREPELGHYSYVIMTVKNGEDWKQSNFVDVGVSPDEETACEMLRQKGMTNTWNLLFMVYRTASIGNYHRSFSNSQLSSIKRTASEMKMTMEGLSGGKMKIGTTDVIVVDEPVTSASKASGHGDPPTLTYGKGQDVDFTYIMDHKDITLVVVVAPLLGMNGGYSWLGLGGPVIRVGSQELFTVIINEIYTSGKRIRCAGGNYLEDSLAVVHEILHAVESNSRKRGWTDFQELHSGDINGYGNGTYYWYNLLMSNTLDNGNYGFLGQSYYVPHKNIPAALKNGRHKDYDGVERYYINGLPHIIDLYIPEMTTAIDAEAFLHIKAKSVLIPNTVKSIGENAFNTGTIIYGEKGSYGQTWANENGFAFVSIVP